MSFNIDDFNAVLGAFNGVQKINLFTTTIVTPRSLSPFYSITDMRTLQFFCMGAFIPSPEIQNAQIRRYGYGLQEDMPFNAGFAPRTFTFIGDGAGFILNFFRDWQRSIIEYSSENDINVPARFSPNVSRLNQGVNAGTSLPFLPYFLNYKNGAKGYASQIQVESLTPDEQAMDVVTLMEAFPINVEDLHLDWGDVDRFAVIEVTFSFRDIMYNFGTRPQVKLSSVIPSDIINSSPSLFSSIGSQISNVAGKLSSLKFI